MNDYAKKNSKEKKGEREREERRRRGPAMRNAKRSRLNFIRRNSGTSSNYVRPTNRDFC